MDSALEAAKNSGAARVPLHLRNAPTGLMKKLGYGKEYKYAHDYEGGWLPESYMPAELPGALFYYPKAAGWEAEFKDQLERRRVNGEGTARQRRQLGKMKSIQAKKKNSRKR